MRFLQVLPTQSDWDRMAHGINRVNRRSASHLHQSVDEVRSAVESNMATWYAVIDDAVTVADLVVKTLQEDDKRTLYVWLMHGSRLQEWAHIAMASLESVAKHNRCNAVRFHTSRPEWVRLFQGDGLGWSHTHVFQKGV